MRKTKLKLNQLNIQSFVTYKTEHTKTIAGREEKTFFCPTAVKLVCDTQLIYNKVVELFNGPNKPDNPINRGSNTAPIKL